MAFQNMINAPNPAVWTPFPMIITASTTAPTKGTISQETSNYLQIGKVLYVQYNLLTSGGGSAGSGTYLFNLPSGFSINSSVLPNGSSFTCGVCYAYNGTAQIGIVTPNTSTNVACFMTNSFSTSNAINSSNFQLTIATSYSLNFWVPIN